MTLPDKKPCGRCAERGGACLRCQFRVEVITSYAERQAAVSEAEAVLRRAAHCRGCGRPLRSVDDFAAGLHARCEAGS